MGEAMEQHFAGRRQIRMLDAGCGGICRVRLSVPTYTVGIDASDDQLARNADLDEGIVGELEQVPIAPDSFDLVVCWNVVEHLREPIETVDRLITALRNDGMLLLAWPNLRSAKAHLTRALPYSMHVSLFRWLYPKAPVTDDRGPFETVLDKRLGPQYVVDAVRSRGLSLHDLVWYESHMQRRARTKLGLTGWRWRALRTLIAGLSGGRVDADRSDVIALFVK
jgi:SAM-dependent methyltransferase